MCGLLVNLKMLFQFIVYSEVLLSSYSYKIVLYLGGDLLWDYKLHIFVPAACLIQLKWRIM